MCIRNKSLEAASFIDDIEAYISDSEAKQQMAEAKINQTKEVESDVRVHKREVSLWSLHVSYY